MLTGFVIVLIFSSWALAAHCIVLTYYFPKKSGCVSAAASIYKNKKTWAREISNIKKDRINGKIILKYHRSLATEWLSIARTLKCRATLKLISRSFNKPFIEATNDDVVDFKKKSIRKLDISNLLRNKFQEGV